MKTSLRFLAALLLLAFAASVAEAAAWMGACPHGPATLPAPGGHSHPLPGVSGPETLPPAPAHDCPLAATSHGGCAVVPLAAPAITGEFPPSLQTQEAVAPAEAHALLLARDRFHPPRR